MAKVYISEYIGTAVPGTSIVKEPEIQNQIVAIGSGSVQSAPFTPATHLIRVHTDAICSIAIGVDPTATSSTKRLALGQTEYFVVTPAHRIAVITNS